MFSRLPDDLPAFLGATFASGFMAFGFSGLFAEIAFGRPSSTSALGFFFVPIWSVVFGLVGLAVGGLMYVTWPIVSGEKSDPEKRRAWLLATGLATALAAMALGAETLMFVGLGGLVVGIALFAGWQKAVGPETEPRRARFWLLALYLGVVVAASAVGVTLALVGEAGAKPEVLIDKGLLQAVPAPSPTTAVRKAVRYDCSNAPQSLEWGRKSTELLVSRKAVTIRDRRSKATTSISIEGLDYVTRVHTTFLDGSPGEDPFLVLVVSGRATGHRAILAVLSPAHEVIHEERIERTWPTDWTPLEVRLDDDSAEVAVLARAWGHTGVGSGLEISLFLW